MGLLQILFFFLHAQGFGRQREWVACCSQGAALNSVHKKTRGLTVRRQLATKRKNTLQERVDEAPKGSC